MPMEVGEGEANDAEDGVVDDEERRHRDAMRGKSFTIKRLIKVLHIAEPVQHVLSILGKK